MSVYFRLFPPLRTWLTYDVIGNTPIYFFKAQYKHVVQQQELQLQVWWKKITGEQDK